MTDMPNNSPEKPNTEAFTIDEFCRRNAISPALYHKLKRENRGPAEMVIGPHSIRISVTAEKEWHAAMAKPVGEVAERLAAEARERISKAKHAAKLSVESDKHVSCQRKAARTAERVYVKIIDRGDGETK
jgi:hypothetical protein